MRPALDSATEAGAATEATTEAATETVGEEGIGLESPEQPGSGQGRFREGSGKVQEARSAGEEGERGEAGGEQGAAAAVEPRGKAEGAAEEKPRRAVRRSASFSTRPRRHRGEVGPDYGKVRTPSGMHRRLVASDRAAAAQAAADEKRAASELAARKQRAKEYAERVRDLACGSHHCSRASSVASAVSVRRGRSGSDPSIHLSLPPPFSHPASGAGLADGGGAAPGAYARRGSTDAAAVSSLRAARAPRSRFT